MDGEAVLKSVGNGKRKKAGPPICCIPGCHEARGLGRRYCVDHRELEEDE
jgi:hypothetical protein